jgi:drug/metabolite transporter (DMT)-like permease
MVADDLGQGTDTLVGDLFAILGAIFAAAYFLIGRHLRSAGTTWLSYVTVAYSTSAFVLVVMAAIAGEAFTGYGQRTYAFMVFLALVPQLIGHTALNRSLGYLPAVAVTIAVLGEPVGATILAAVFLEEWPTVVEVCGALLILLGVYFGLRAPAAASLTERPVD